MSDIGHFDGACEPVNPGGALGWGWVLTGDDGWQQEGKGYRAAAHGNTNNLAEYAAFVSLLKAYRQSDRQGPLHVQGDSMLVVRQVNGDWRCNSEQLRRFRDMARDLCASIPGGVTITHVPREQNAKADALSVAAIEEHGIKRAVRGGR